MEPEELTSPKLEAIEDLLALNHDEFVALLQDWGREWQRAMQRRAMQRKRRRQKEAAEDVTLDRAA
jgi:hypothetical protein